MAINQSVTQVACWTDGMHKITDGTPHNCYSNQQSVCPTCCPVALRLSPTIQTVHLQILSCPTFSLQYLLHIWTKSKLQNTDGKPHNFYGDQESDCLPLDFSLNREALITDDKLYKSFSVQMWICLIHRKPQITHGTPHICYSAQQSGCTISSPLAQTEITKMHTVHRTITIEANIQSDLTVAIFYWQENPNYRP